MIEALPPPLHFNVGSFLSLKDVKALCCTSKSCPKQREVNIKIDQPDSDFDRHPSNGYAAYVWQSFDFPPSRSRHLLHHCSIDCKWKDQGWGNRKGMLSVVKNGGNAPGDYLPSGEDVVAEKQPAPHKEELLHLDFNLDPAAEYHMWVRIGGGGGHQLFFRSTTVTAYEFII
ncbi:hypothetical protein TrST_g4216 [Triparma strigata]|uniref:Uncharacterized protein n=1 Tax=Triparma strigata TaxID=1606541 RepID=A0A9W6ZCT8_9STRA|nr:hypothetical protein TrST_g4216 [Triparma strigata]